MLEVQLLRQSSPSVVAMLNRLLKQLSTDPPQLTEKALEDILRSETRVYVAVDDGWIVGTASLVPVQQLMGSKCWIEDVVVDAQYRGQGLGRKLMEFVIADAPVYTTSINLVSSVERGNARQLYRSLGFEQRQKSDLFRLRLTRHYLVRAT